MWQIRGARWSVRRLWQIFRYIVRLQCPCGSLVIIAHKHDGLLSRGGLCARTELSILIYSATYLGRTIPPTVIYLLAEAAPEGASSDEASREVDVLGLTSSEYS